VVALNLKDTNRAECFVSDGKAGSVVELALLFTMCSTSAGD